MPLQVRQSPGQARFVSSHRPPSRTRRLDCRVVASTDCWCGAPDRNRLYTPGPENIQNIVLYHKIRLWGGKSCTILHKIFTSALWTAGLFFDGRLKSGRAEPDTRNLNSPRLVSLRETPPPAGRQRHLQVRGEDTPHPRAGATPRPTLFFLRNKALATGQKRVIVSADKSYTMINMRMSRGHTPEEA
jgi:hypothetical protein